MLGADASNGYDTITVANVFRLRPPPKPEEQPPPPRARITLLGMVAVDGKCAILRIEPPAQSPAAGKPVILTLKPGERQDKIQLLEIDEKKERVRVRDGDTETEVTFADARTETADPVRLVGHMAVGLGRPSNVYKLRTAN
ncbi:MAG: hypothetical protein C5B50_23870 [Verrucomicrobia bacterium]|nr:MAG: hypothetical protein C5B50_23870 [Verrucomicrobiota bacterium]